MPRKECPENEDIVRAIRSSDWDEKNKRWSSNLFRGPNTSVSRLTVLPLRQLFGIFLKDLHKPPVHKVIKAGEINIGHLSSLGKSFESNNKSDPRNITVEEDPIIGIEGLTDNPAHAEIPQKLPKSLAIKIARELTLHDAPAPNRPSRARWIVFAIILVVLLCLMIFYFLL